MSKDDLIKALCPSPEEWRAMDRALFQEKVMLEPSYYITTLFLRVS